MPVFKLCIKIIKKNIPSLLIYVDTFLFVLIFIASNFSKNQPVQTSFMPSKSNVAFISVESSPIIDGFKKELSKVANFVELKDETEALQDALYFRSVTYIIRIPDGFTERFMNGENVEIEKTIVPNSISNMYIDLSINQYFNTARLYVNQNKNITQEQLVSNVEKDLSISTPVELKTSEKTAAELSYTAYYFNYLSYALLSVLILGISVLMLVFNNPDLKRRNACSPISSSSINLQFILANLLFTLVAWVIMSGFYFVLNPEKSVHQNIGYFLLNSFVFALCGVSISYLIGISIKGQNAISAVSNVVSLGFSFISGVFVPQEYLGSSVLQVASFTPTYWYVKANNQIAELTQFDFLHMKTVLSYILIELGFAIAFFVLALVVGKKKSIR